MTGPEFLQIYAVIIVAAWLWAHWQSRAARSAPTGEPSEPTPPLNSRELAFLRGGVSEVIRLTVFALVARGHLQTLNQKILKFETGVKLGPAEDPPTAQDLDPLEALVHRFFQAPRPPASIFQDADLLEGAAAQCRDAEQRLNQAALLTPAETRRHGVAVSSIAVGVILSTGLLRLLYALSKGSDQVGYLIVMGLIGAGVAVGLSRVPRLSPRGRSYLASHQEKFADLKERITRLEEPSDVRALVAAVALFGFSVLEGTAYAKLAAGFPRAASTGGCGGGGCSGGGCGGGCGGCGGCG